jgi:hypothetical protein
LQRLFEPFGRIEETKVIKDRATGLSKGFGFVKFSDAREAKEVGCDTFGSEAALVSWLLRGLIRNQEHLQQEFCGTFVCDPLE